MVDKHVIAQVMCAACGHIFPYPTVLADEDRLNEEVACPACETYGKPKGVMQPSGFPSLETFERNWKKSKSVDVSDTSEKTTDSKTLAKSCQVS